MDQPGVEYGEGGGHDPAMEARVGRLEEDMRDVKATLLRLEPMIVRIDATMPFLAKASDLADLRGELRTELHTELGRLRTELHSELGGMRGELHSELGKIRVELAGKASLAGVWTVGITLLGLTVAGMAAGAIYLPLLFRVLHLAAP